MRIIENLKLKLGEIGISETPIKDWTQEGCSIKMYKETYSPMEEINLFIRDTYVMIYISTNRDLEELNNDYMNMIHRLNTSLINETDFVELGYTPIDTMFAEKEEKRLNSIAFNLKITNIRN